MPRWFLASYKASLTARDVPVGPHHSNCNHSQAPSWQRCHKKESDHQTGGWNSWILSSVISSGLRFSIKQHESWEHSSSKLGPASALSGAVLPIILEAMSTSQGPLEVISCTRWALRAEPNTAHSQEHYCSLHNSSILLKILSDNDSEIQTQSISEDTPFFTADIEEKENTEQLQEE